MNELETKILVRDAICHEYIELRPEESFFRQKPRVQWLNIGEQNTAFFFGQAMTSLHGISKIVTICREDGTIMGNHKVMNIMVEYFKKLLCTSSGAY